MKTATQFKFIKTGMVAAIALALSLPIFTSRADAQAGTGAAKVYTPWSKQGKLAAGISVTGTSAATALPSVGLSAWICNTGANDAYLEFGSSGVAATAAAGTWLKSATCATYDLYPVGQASRYGYVAAITATSTTTLTVETGSGQGPDQLVASGGGGGGGAVTMASGAVASGAYSAGSLAAGSMVDLLTMRQTVAAGTAASNSMLTGGIYNSTPITLTNGQGAANQFDANGYLKVNVAAGGAGGGAITIASGAVAAGAYSAGSLALGAAVDGWNVTLGATTDAACGTPTGNCSLIALQKYNNTATSGALPAQVTDVWIGNVKLQQGSSLLSTTNGIYANGLQGNAVLSLSNPTFTRVTDGTTGVTVKAASTAPTTTDTALVAALRPATPVTPIAAAANDNHATLKNGAGVAMSVHTSNNSSTANYLRLYDAGTGFNGCNSATGVIFAMEIPPSNSGFTVSLGGGVGIAFTNGLSWCITSGFGLTDTTAATASAIYANASYR